jgi:hypothetical protein
MAPFKEMRGAEQRTVARAPVLRLILDFEPHPQPTRKPQHGVGYLLIEYFPNAQPSLGHVWHWSHRNHRALDGIVVQYALGNATRVRTVI